MNYIKYLDLDVVNGPGTRCTLFVAGCELACKGCYNRKFWQPDTGFHFTNEVADAIIEDLNDSRIRRRGLSLLGGDPLHPANVNDVLALVQRVRDEAPGKDIWCWTGYTLAQLNPAQQQVVDLIDVLIDGPFEQDLADPSLKWRGSSNQVIHTLSEYN